MCGVVSISVDYNAEGIGHVHASLKVPSYFRSLSLGLTNLSVARTPGSYRIEGFAFAFLVLLQVIIAVGFHLYFKLLFSEVSTFGRVTIRFLDE